MPYPAEISSTANLQFPFCGPPRHISETVVYQMLFETSGTDHFQMHRSTDAGLTWAEQDFANRPSTSNVAADSRCGFTAFDGTRIWVDYIASGPSAALKAFNTSTNLWETTITGADLPGDPTSGGSINTGRETFITVRSSGDIVRVFSVWTGAIVQLWLQVYSSGSWSTAVAILAEDVSELDFIDDYNGVALVTDDDDQSHLFAWTASGIAYIRINANNTTSNYLRFDPDDMLGELGHSRFGSFGEARIVTLGSVRFCALPHNFLLNFDGNTYFRPGVYLIPTDGTVTHDKIERINERTTTNDFLTGVGLNWHSACVDYDPVREMMVLFWASDASSGVGFSPSVRASASKGFGWTSPVTVFTPGVGTGPIETLEGTVRDGLFRLVIENSNSGTFLQPHYWQGTVDLDPEGCPSSETVAARFNIE